VNSGASAPGRVQPPNATPKGERGRVGLAHDVLDTVDVGAVSGRGTAHLVDRERARDATPRVLLPHGRRGDVVGDVDNAHVGALGPQPVVTTEVVNAAGSPVVEDGCARPVLPQFGYP